MASCKGKKLDKQPWSRVHYGLFLCVGVNVFLTGISDWATLAGSIPPGQKFAPLLRSAKYHLSKGTEQHIPRLPNRNGR